MYKTITLNSCSESIQCDKGPVIFVGPNGSGKSILLRELALEAAMNPRIVESSESKILDKRWYDGIKNHLHREISSIRDIYFSDDLRYIKNFHFLAKIKTLGFIPSFYRMDGKGRFSVFPEKGKGENLWSHQHASLHEKLFKDDVLHKKLAALLLAAFGKYFILDHGNQLGMYTVKFSESEQNKKGEFDQEMKSFYNSATPLSQCSDGMQAYTAILATFIASDNLFALMVDEPEAFLHPTLASLLGRQLSEVAAERDCNLFAATHSPDFLKGCIQSGKPVQIVRMERINDISKIRSISADELRTLLQDPLIKSTNVLSGLFADGVIVVEGDSDRVFYNEIFERLRVKKDIYKPLPLFINGYGKPTVFKITEALRKFGVPAAAIVDFDYFKDNWKNGLSSIYLPESMKNPITTWRKGIKNDGEWKKAKLTLSNDEAESFAELSKPLASYGLFIVPDGSVESWLSSLGVHSGNKKKMAS